MIRSPEQISNAIDTAAIDKANAPSSANWLPYQYEAVNGGILVTGCATRPKKRGPNKGKPMFLTRLHSIRVVVTKGDIDAAIKYERGQS